MKSLSMKIKCNFRYILCYWGIFFQNSEVKRFSILKEIYFNFLSYKHKEALCQLSLYRETQCNWLAFRKNETMREQDISEILKYPHITLFQGLDFQCSAISLYLYLCIFQFLCRRLRFNIGSQTLNIYCLVVPRNFFS